VETFTTSHFWAFFILWSILIYAMIFEIVLRDLIFYIHCSWIPKNSSVDPWGFMDPRLGTTDLGKDPDRELLLSGHSSDSGPKFELSSGSFWFLIWAPAPGKKPTSDAPATGSSSAALVYITKFKLSLRQGNGKPFMKTLRLQIIVIGSSQCMFNHHK